MAVYLNLLCRKLICLLVGFLSHNVHISDCLFGDKLLVVLYDGFRWDYSALTDTPNLDKVVSLGATAHHMDPVFPTQTGPCMYSIATGMYPENHGIVGSSLYDPQLDSERVNIFATSDEVKVKLYKGTEPIWVTAMKAGLKTACYDWPGCDVDISGYKTDFVEPHQEFMSQTHQIDLAMQWFTKDDVSLVLLHFNQPDKAGHRTGPAPESSETLAMIRQMDNVTGYMLDQLEQRGILEEVNVLMLADHGMASVSVDDRSVPLHDHIDPLDIDVMVAADTHVNILPVEGKLEKVYNDIKDIHPNVSVYLKEEIPERFHYSKHYRVLPILALADEGWLLHNNASQPDRILKGTHGYDNSLMSMKPFFYAMGPDIVSQTRVEPFSQVDLCPLMCKLLGLTPNHSGNGTFATFNQMVRKSPADMRGWLILMTSLGMVALVLLISAVIVACRRHIGYDAVIMRPEDADEKRYLYHKLDDTPQSL